MVGKYQILVEVSSWQKFSLSFQQYFNSFFCGGILARTPFSGNVIILNVDWGNYAE